MIKVTATPKFVRQAKKAMTSEALQALIDELSITPEKGVLIVGSGGIRKLRWRTGKDNKGKSGGIRVIYYYDNDRLIVLLIDLFKKSDRNNIDAGEKAALKKLLPELLEAYTHE
jgi:hypothetical protein